MKAFSGDVEDRHHQQYAQTYVEPSAVLSRTCLGLLVVLPLHLLVSVVQDSSVKRVQLISEIEVNHLRLICCFEVNFTI